MSKENLKHLEQINGSGVTPAIHDLSNDEWRDCGVNGVQCTRDGRFRTKEGREIKTFFHANGIRLWICFGGKNNKMYIARTLIAKAWIDDYYDGCYLKYLDGDRLNIHADNTQVCDVSEYRRWHKILSLQKKFKGYEQQYGEFKPTGVEDISVTSNGVCMRNGIIYKPHNSVMENGNKLTSMIVIRIGGTKRFFVAAKLVAMAWLPKLYFEGCYITFRDGNKHNLHVDNLRVCGEEDWDKYRNKGHQKKAKERFTIDSEIEILDDVAKCCGMSKRLLLTGDYTEINEYVKDDLLPRLMQFAIKTIAMTRSQARAAVPIAISHLYELLDTNRGVCMYYWYCMKALRRIKKEGVYVQANLPIKIERVNNSDLEALCDKFRLTKI